MLTCFDVPLVGEEKKRLGDEIDKAGKSLDD
jgi:hypothetical protein